MFKKKQNSKDNDAVKSAPKHAQDKNSSASFVEEASGKHTVSHESTGKHSCPTENQGKHSPSHVSNKKETPKKSESDKSSPLEKSEKTRQSSKSTPEKGIKAAETKKSVKLEKSVEPGKLTETEKSEKSKKQNEQLNPSSDVSSIRQETNKDKQQNNHQDSEVTVSFKKVEKNTKHAKSSQYASQSSTQNVASSTYQASQNDIYIEPVKPINIEYTADKLTKKRQHKKSVKSGQAMDSFSIPRVAETASKHKKLIVFLIIAILLVAVGIACYFFLQNMDFNPTVQKEKVPLSINTQDYKANQSTRIPVKYAGEKADGNYVDDYTFYDMESGTVELEKGTYNLTLTSSPLTEDGTFYSGSSETIHVNLVSDDNSENSANSSSKSGFTLTKKDPALTSESIVNEAAQIALKDTEASKTSGYETKVETYRSNTIDVCKEASNKYNRASNAVFNTVIDQYNKLVKQVGTSYLKKYYPDDDNKNSNNNTNSKDNSSYYSASSIVSTYTSMKSSNQYLVISNQLPVKYAKTDIDNDGANELVVMGDSCIIGIYKYIQKDNSIEFGNLCSYNEKQVLIVSKEGSSGSSSSSSTSKGTTVDSTTIANTAVEDKICIDGYIFHKETKKADGTKTSSGNSTQGQESVVATLYRLANGKQEKVEEISATKTNGQFTDVVWTNAEGAKKNLDASKVENTIDQLKNRYSEKDSGGGWTIFN